VLCIALLPVSAQQAQGGSYRVVNEYSFQKPIQAAKETRDPLGPDQVILLPKYFIHDKVPVFEPVERYQSDPKARVALAKKRCLSPIYMKTFGPLGQLIAYYMSLINLLGGWHPNDGEALLLLDQEEHLRRVAEVDYLVSIELYDHSIGVNDYKKLRRELMTIKSGFIINR